MAIKRQGPSPRRSAVKAEVPSEVSAPVQASTKPAQRVRRVPAKPRIVRTQASPPPETYQSGTFLSREEKRQIILAHANMRKPHDPVQIMSMWAGVLACLLVVAVGWWWTVRPEIGKQFVGTVKPALAQSSEEFKNVGQLFKDLSQNGLFNPLDTKDPKIKTLTEKVSAQKAALFHLTALENTDATGTGAVQGRDIFVPTSNPSSTGN